MTANKRNFRMATACLFAATQCTVSLAQQPTEGIVKISDSRHGLIKTVSKGEYHAPPAMYGQSSTYDFDPSAKYYGGMGHGHGKFKEHYCTHSPDHGYSIPGKWPIHRRGVEYQQLFPNAYYSVYGGAPGAVAAPQVYTPTDTTQLGYYYQHVPFWQPQPNPLPPRPIPAQWHHYAPAVYASQYGEVYSRGGVVEGEVIYESAPAATTPATTAPSLQPVPDAVPAPQAVPPEPLKESSVPLPLQRASY